MSTSLMAIDRKLDKLLANAAAATPPPATSAPSAVKPTEPIAPAPAPIPVAPPPAPPVPPVRPVVPVTAPPAVPPPPPPRVPPAPPPFSAPHTTSQATAAHVAATHQPPLSSLLSSQSISRSGSDVEEMIAGHWLNYVGILAMAIAVAFFLKYAFDNNWIGPSGRVAIGVLIGTAISFRVLICAGIGRGAEPAGNERILRAGHRRKLPLPLGALA